MKFNIWEVYWRLTFPFCFKSKWPTYTCSQGNVMLEWLWSCLVSMVSQTVRSYNKQCNALCASSGELVVPQNTVVSQLNSGTCDEPDLPNPCCIQVSVCRNTQVSRLERGQLPVKPHKPQPMFSSYLSYQFISHDMQLTVKEYHSTVLWYPQVERPVMLLNYIAWGICLKDKWPQTVSN